jgi:hypothetical protein
MHQARRIVGVFLWQVVLEHVRWLDGVVVDADQNHVVFVHCPVLSIGVIRGPPTFVAGLSTKPLRR